MRPFERVQQRPAEHIINESAPQNMKEGVEVLKHSSGVIEVPKISRTGSRSSMSLNFWKKLSRWKDEVHMNEQQRTSEQIEDAPQMLEVVVAQRQIPMVQTEIEAF